MKFFEFIPSGTNIDFIGKFKYFLAFSIIAGIAIIVGIFTKGLNYGIDFTGGTVMQIKFKEPRPTEDVRKLMDAVQEKDASVVSLGEGHLEYLITTRTAGSNKDAKNLPLNKKLVDHLGADKVQILSADIVGPKVGAELKLAALRSLFYTVLLIMVYIWLRFDFRFAPGATVAMVHDLLMTTGFYLVTGSEFTITAIAALLTIAGYSVNDTIVIYDRAREIMKKGGDSLSLPDVLNRSVNITLSRTIVTSGVTLISVIPIAIFTQGEIKNFAFAMIFGLFVGTYSTIYIAAPFTIYVEKFLAKKKVKDQSKPRPRPATV